VLASTVEHALHGLKPASEAFFGKKVLFVLSGKEWQGLRQQMRPAFASHNLGPMIDDTADKAEIFADILEPYAASGRDVDILLATSSTISAPSLSRPSITTSTASRSLKRAPIS